MRRWPLNAALATQSRPAPPQSRPAPPPVRKKGGFTHERWFFAGVVRKKGGSTHEGSLVYVKKKYLSAGYDNQLNMQDKKDALQAREKGLSYIQEYNFAMAAIEFMRAIEAGDAQSYCYKCRRFISIWRLARNFPA